MNIKSSLKTLLVPSGIRPYKVIFGAFRGLKMEIDLQYASQFWVGLYERETYRWIRQFAAGCCSGVDVGAAQGEFTLYLLRSSRASRIVAFDPDPEYDATFTRNLNINGFSEGDRLMRFRQFVGIGANGTVRLDTFVGILSSPVFIRVDVDGFEMDVLQGAVGMLEQMKVRLLVETHSVELEKRCKYFLQKLGYHTKIVKNAWWRTLLKDQRPIGFNRWLVASNDPSSPV
jgi:hypothetical protein